MQKSFPLIPVLAMMLFTAVMMCIAYLTVHKPAEGRAQVAQQLNFTFAPGDVGEMFLTRHGRFELFQKGRRGRVSNLMQGTLNGVEIDLFDYTYVTGSASHGHTRTQSVLRFTVKDGVSWPRFSLRPEGVFDKVGAWLGSQDINFADYPAFSERYLLRGANVAAVRAIFTPQVLSYYESLPPVCIEGNGRYFLYYRPSYRVNPGGIAGFLQGGMMALSQFCPSVSGNIYLMLRKRSR